VGVGEGIMAGKRPCDIVGWGHDALYKPEGDTKRACGPLGEERTKTEDERPACGIG